MSDRGEKIVTLATAMMQEPDSAFSSLPQNSRTSWKAMAMAVVVAATSSGASVAWLAEQNRPLDRYERVELAALIHYAAQTAHEDESSIKKDLLTQFMVGQLDEMTHSQFGEAKQFLQNKIH